MNKHLNVFVSNLMIIEDCTPQTNVLSEVHLLVRVKLPSLLQAAREMMARNNFLLTLCHKTMVDSRTLLQDDSFEGFRAVCQFIRWAIHNLHLIDPIIATLSCLTMILTNQVIAIVASRMARSLKSNRLCQSFKLLSQSSRSVELNF